MTRTQVFENMSQNLVTINWSERMEDAYRKMQVRKVRHLPVMDDQGGTVGMLSDRDVQRAMISTIDKKEGRLFSDENIEFDKDCLVRDYMSWPVKSVDQSADLRLVAEQMINDKVSSFLVTDSQKVVGIVTVEDLLKVLVELLGDSGTPIKWTLRGLVTDSVQYQS
jgi:acetoin utilization protein AcuB